MKSQLVIFLIAALLLNLSSCEDSLILKEKLGSFETDSSIKIYPADTGYIPYGQTWEGILVLANPIDACAPLKNDVNNPDNKRVFVVAQRGKCLFVEKAENVQQFGAQALIIADLNNTDLEKVNIMDITENQFFISIMLINTANGNSLISALKLKSNSQVSAALKFELEEKSKIIDYEYFFSSLQLTSYDFIQNLLNVYDDFHSQSGMQIIFEIYTFLDNQGFPHSNDCYGGKYCAVDPDIEGPLSGRDQIQFDLNILCLQEQLGGQSDSTKNFLRYLIDFRDFCLMNIPLKNLHLYELNDCFFKVYEKEKNLYQFAQSSALFKQNIESCVSSSFIDSDHKNNPLLDQSLDKIESYGVTISPELFVNGKRIHGNIGNGQELSDLLCRLSANPPSQCNLEIENHKMGSSTGKIIGIIFLSLAFGVLFIVLALFCYRRSLKIQLRDDVNETVQSVVSSYMAMHEGK